MFEAVLARFAEQCPVAVMAQLALRRALRPEWVDAVFEAHADQQYTRELLFSTVVELMGLVAIGLRPSLHAAARHALADGTLGVSLQALYAKVSHSEPAVLRALVRESAARLAPVAAALRPPGAPTTPAWLTGYRVRVLDGTHFAPTEKRLKALRGRRSAALPGQALVLYAPEQDLVVDQVVGDDAHAQELRYVPPLVAAAQPGELWLADRNFATRGLLAALHARGAAVLVREHGRYPAPTPAGERQCVGRGEAGVVYEQPVDCPGPTAATAPLRLRRIEVALALPLASGETVLRLLTTLPATVPAPAVAELYRRRWTIEGLFQRLQGVLHSEVPTLGMPRAALLAFSVAVVAYNVLAVVHAAVEGHAAEVARATHAAAVPISTYHVAQTVREYFHGLLLAVPEEGWARYDAQRPAELAASLRQLAAKVRLEAYRKHPRGSSGPRRPKGHVPPAERSAHIATARVLAEYKQQQRQQAP
jgi:IS4 transposase